MGELFQPTHLLLVGLIAMIFLGPKRLPELGKGLGEGIRGFRDAFSGGGSKEAEQRKVETIEPKRVD
jgi:sec-independent protein translocase protein TatA